MKDIVCMVLFFLLLPLTVPFWLSRMAWMISGVLADDFEEWLRNG